MLSPLILMSLLWFASMPIIFDGVRDIRAQRRYSPAAPEKMPYDLSASRGQVQ